ncbi:MAG: O-antigen ligase family protein [Acidobacteriaceae bacterium]|nr:O-antigen ligase family protein [Acidobacteriaceae bacterium]
MLVSEQVFSASCYHQPVSRIVTGEYGQRYATRILFVLVALSVLSTLVVSHGVWNSSVTAKALCMRCSVLLAFPFYVYHLFAFPRLRPRFSNPVTVSVLSFVAINTLATLFGVNPRHSFWGDLDRMGGLFQLLHLTLLYFCFLQLASCRHIDVALILKLLIWIAGIASLLGLAEAYKPGDFPAIPAQPYRISSVFGHPIFLASFLVLPIALTVTVICRRRHSKAALSTYAALLLLQLSAVLLSGTRGAFVGLLVGVVVAAGLLSIRIDYFLLRAARLRVLTTLLAVLVLACALTWLSEKNPSVHHLLAFKDSSSLSRLVEWRTAIRGYKERPFIGTGPENYYVVHNMYFDTTLYDVGKNGPWLLDKPHNYLLEILVTTGLFGAIGYISIVIFTVLAFWRGYRSQSLSRSECCVLIGGAIAYQAQNFFAFDMPASSLAFYVYTGFAASFYVKLESSKKTAADPVIVSVTGFKKLLVATIATLSVCGIIVIDGFTFVKVRDLARARDSEARGQPQLASMYLDEAAQPPFVYYLRDVGIQYANFIARLPSLQADPRHVDKRVLQAAIASAIKILEEVTRAEPNYADVWKELGNLYDRNALLTGEPSDPRILRAINEAIRLAPGRLEYRYFLIQYELVAGRGDAALAMSEDIARRFPDNAEARWTLAKVYSALNNTELAAKTASEAVLLGYEFRSLPDFIWLINYYIDRRDYGAVAALYERAISFRPKDYLLYESLAATYRKSGNIDKAISAAVKVEELNPSRRAATQTFLRSLRNK